MTPQFAPFYPLIYRLLYPRFPGCLWQGNANQPQIALTFDDGPHPQHTPALLEVLKHHRVSASFFWLGVCVERAPEVARAVCQQGHWIGLHGYDHRPFPLLSPTELQQSLEKTRQAIAQSCDLDPQTLRDVRPPYGFFTPQTLTLLRQWQYQTVMWSVVPEDWVAPGVAVVVRRVLNQTRNGSLIVLHDGYTGGHDVAATTDQLIPCLLKQGYQFVTIPQLRGCPI